MIRARFVATTLVGFSVFACSSDEDKSRSGGDASTETGGSSGTSSDAGTGGKSASGGSGGSSSTADAATDAAPPLEPGTIVQTPLGRIQGYKDGATERFLGIPYAKPPVGDMRWKPPAPVDAWKNVLDARAFGNVCAQPSWIQQPEPSFTEDCLFLNVWTPDVAPTKPLPVMVWIPGGGNQNGGASDRSPLTQNEFVYLGKSLATHGNVIVVTVNYRLGPFGFFAHPALTDEGSNSGNQGLMDQRAALEWVKDNISAFGGDPKRVTLFGESAGSQDTCLHMVSPPSDGLFHRAISESGGCTTYRKTKATAEAQVAAYAEAVGCSKTADQLACLRGKSAQELLLTAPVDGPDGGADLPGGSQFSGGTARWDFNPVVDGTVIPDQPRDLVEAGKFAKVPYVMGANFEEGRLFFLGATPVKSEAEYEGALERLFGDKAASVVSVYPIHDFNDDPMAALVRVWGDYRLGCSTYTSARRFAAKGATIRTYTFQRMIPGLEILQATHGVELPYVFGTLVKPGADDQTLIDAAQGYWSRFAATGDPNGDGALEWPEFSGDDRKFMLLDTTTKVVTDFRKAQCDFWETIYDAQGN